MLTGIVTQENLLQSFRRGVEFCCFKPIDDFTPLCNAIERTFGKIDRWWDALHYLSAERRV
jgi:hypothetical protein